MNAVCLHELQELLVVVQLGIMRIEHNEMWPAIQKITSFQIRDE